MKDFKVLIVDDSEIMRMVAKQVMTMNGFAHIAEAADVVAAEKELEKCKVGRKLGLIISDYNMPGKNGLDFLKSVKANKDFAQVPFIFMSTNTDKEIIGQMIVNGAKGYILKPFTAESFETTLKKVIKF
jgi:two-component system chemotaxis response regulator CheY